MANDSEHQIWIVGSGKVGTRALNLLSQDNDPSILSMVDTVPCDTGPVTAFTMDGVDFLIDRVDAQCTAWIVPAIPSHLAFEWLSSCLKRVGPFQKLPTPQGISSGLKYFSRDGGGRAYVSNADFLCPADCCEPDVCTVTGEMRPLVMYEHLARSCPDDLTPLIIRSHQLAPGVGGFRASDLWRALETTTRDPGRYIMATACKCHGVVDAFSNK